MTIYQAITKHNNGITKREVLHFERETLTELHDAIVSYGFEYLPDFSIQLMGDDEELLAFDDTAFLAELRDGFDESVVSAHFQMEAGY